MSDHMVDSVRRQLCGNHWHATLASCALPPWPSVLTQYDLDVHFIGGQRWACGEPESIQVTSPWICAAASAPSHLLADGVPLPIVSARLGHSSVRVTAEIYSHMIHGQDDEAARRWDEFQGRNSQVKLTGVQ